MRQRDKQAPQSAEETIRRATRRHFSAEEKTRIVLDGLRGEDSRKALPPHDPGKDRALVPLAEKPNLGRELLLPR
jgi:hypothetical protein